MAEGGHQKRLQRALDELTAIPDPVARLDALRRARGTLEELETAAAADARAAGVTWKAIGALYGLSKQGAQQRFAPPAGRRVPGAATDA